MGLLNYFQKSCFVLDIENVFTFLEILIFISKLDIVGYEFLFIYSTFRILKKTFIGAGRMKIVGLCKIDLDSNLRSTTYPYIVHTDVGIKMSLKVWSKWAKFSGISCGRGVTPYSPCVSTVLIL